VEILVGESVFFDVCCANAVPAPLFFSSTPLPASNNFRQMFSSTGNQMLFIDQHFAVSNNFFSTYGTVFLKLRYRDTVAFCTKN